MTVTENFVSVNGWFTWVLSSAIIVIGIFVFNNLLVVNYDESFLFPPSMQIFSAFIFFFQVRPFFKNQKLRWVWIIYCHNLVALFRSFAVKKLGNISKSNFQYLLETFKIINSFLKAYSPFQYITSHQNNRINPRHSDVSQLSHTSDARVIAVLPRSQQDWFIPRDLLMILRDENIFNFSFKVIIFL